MLKKILTLIYFLGRRQDERHLQDDERSVQDRGRRRGVRQVWGGCQDDLDPRGAAGGVQLLNFVLHFVMNFLLLMRTVIY